MAEKDPSKTERATGKRREKVREEGNVPKSQEVSKVLVLLAGLIVMRLYMSHIGDDMIRVFRWLLGLSFRFDPTEANVYRLFIDIMTKIAIMVMPVLLVIGVVAYFSIRLQIGSLWTTKKIFSPDFGALFNPVAGLKKLIIDPRTLLRLGKSVLQAAAIGFAAYLALKDEMHTILPLFYQSAQGLASYILSRGYAMVWYTMVPMLLIAAFDLWYTRWDYEENIKMSKDEVKDERRQAEGDPNVKIKQRQKMMQVMMQRMMENVPKADVIITNPTHYAVALRYDAMEAPAPQVLAKGLNHLAERIKAIARENNIPIRENKPLAQALYKSVEVGDVIPEELYQAVASILAQLFKFKRDKR